MATRAFNLGDDGLKQPLVWSVAQHCPRLGGVII